MCSGLWALALAAACCTGWTHCGAPQPAHHTAVPHGGVQRKPRTPEEPLGERRRQAFIGTSHTGPPTEAPRTRSHTATRLRGNGGRRLPAGREQFRRLREEGGPGAGTAHVLWAALDVILVISEKLKTQHVPIAWSTQEPSQGLLLPIPSYFKVYFT